MSESYEIYIKPKLIFAGTTSNLYHPDVIVEFNPTAYNNKDLFLKSIAEEIIPALGSGSSLLLLNAALHATLDVLQSLQSANITPSLIPGGCTALIIYETTRNSTLTARSVRIPVLSGQLETGGYDNSSGQPCMTSI